MDTVNEMERKPYSLDSLRVRCPDCRKLYLVQFNDIKEAKPRFECVQCHSRFSLVMADLDPLAEVIGTPVSGLVPSKPKMHAVDTLVPRSVNLEALWRDVVAHYDDVELHRQFIRNCQREGNLGFAASQYKHMIKLMPADDAAKKYLVEIQAIGETLLPPKSSRPARMFPRIWQLPLIAAALMIVFGMAVPRFRNIVGVGAAFLFLAFAFQVQLRRRS